MTGKDGFAIIKQLRDSSKARIRLPENTDNQKASPVTTATLAAYLGLSRATVVHVLNGRATQQRIRPETQRRVLEAAQVFGYRPNVSARAVRTGRFGCVGLIQCLMDYYLPVELQQGIAEALSERDMHLSLAEAPIERLDEASYVPKVVRELAVDGLLINRMPQIPQDFMERLALLPTPAIFLNVREENDSVHPDDRAGGRLAAEHLLALGHTRIAYAEALSAGPEHYSREERRKGYREAMEAAGYHAQVVTLPPEQAAATADYAARIEAARACLCARNRPTAVVAYELAEVMAFVRAADQLRCAIPGDLSLVVFHRNTDSRLCVPLTTVTNAMDRVGREAVQMLCKKIEAPNLPLPSRRIPVDVIAGGTSAPPSKTNRIRGEIH